MDLMKKTGVYIIVNKINGKIYVGQTLNKRGFIGRWYSHKKCNDNYPLYNSMKKYGTEAFDFQPVLISDDLDEINKIEKQLIKALNTTDRRYGYNIQLGGSKGKFSKESKLKMRKAKIGKYLGKENPNYGKGQTEFNKNRTMESNAKYHLIVSPDGVINKVYNLNQWCKDNNLDRRNLYNKSGSNGFKKIKE